MATVPVNMGVCSCCSKMFIRDYVIHIVGVIPTQLDDSDLVHQLTVRHVTRE